MEIFPKTKISKKLLFGIVLLLIMLLSINILLINMNNEKVKRSRKLSEEAEKVKLNTLDVIRNLHQLDMGLRGFALTRSAHQTAVVNETYIRKDVIFDTLQVLLSSQHFPMVRFERMRDSVDIYFKFVLHLHQLEKKNDHAQFLLLLNEDRGYAAFRAYKSFSDEIDLFEERLFAQYDSSYESALRSTLLFQIVLFLVSIPSLTYTTVFASRSLSISEKLRRAQQETAEILEQQKQKLEMVVRSRTNEIRKQNEEITLSNQQLLEQQRKIEQHHHALSQQNARIKGAHHIIELQNTIIQKKNEELKQEVALQVQDLRKTNAELLEQNSRLEQFAFIISHNLRAPMTRIVGLASVISLQPTEQERSDLIEKMVLSTRELDEVIKDLSMIIQIQNLNTSVYRLISLPDLINKVKTILKLEIENTGAQIVTTGMKIVFILFLSM